MRHVIDAYRLIALQAHATLEKGAELPSRLVVFPWGTQQTNKGAITCNETTLSSVPRNNRQMKFERVALDFQHNTVPGHESYQGEPAKVAAHADVVVLSGEGVVFDNIEWTPEGKEHAENGHYPDVSLAPALNEKGEIIFVHSAAICRQGEVDGVTLFPNSAELNLTPLNPNLTPSPEIEKVMKDTLLVLLSSAGYSVNADSTDEQIQDAAKEFAQKLENKTEKKDTPDKLEPDTALSARIEKLEQGQQTQARTSLVERAAREGKVIPLSAEQIEALPVETLSSMVDQLAVTVPLDQRTNEKGQEIQLQTLSAEQKAINAQLGIDDETFKKYNT